MKGVKIYTRPSFLCFIIGMTAGIGLEILYQKSGYCEPILLFLAPTQIIFIDKAIDAELRRKNANFSANN